ncbi:BolA family protein [Aliiroseovarius sp.]|uniref:BolA family protein n=1 Tax=Aliiroseovarius sp. TaxID=1872442 RepID=UPI00262DB662|nr:BolA family protein [Aliiroseovarius sp.]
MSRSEEIREKLEAAFQPRMLQVVNESSRHQGHAGDDGSGESHFRVVIAAEAFAGQTRVARHRMVHKALGSELTSAIHALSLEITE